MRGTAWLAAAGMALLGALVLARHLHLEWDLNPQYSHGWLVAPLAGLLGWMRWRDRPAPTPVAGAVRWVLPVLLAGAFFPLRVLLEANPEWRLLYVALGLWAAAAGLAGLWLAGGLAWLRHFAFPVVFLLVAVPWPSVIEHAVVQGLMRVVAGVTAETLSWAGVLAVREGNLIHLQGVTVGVDEACSGVRSLQSSLMAALFVGEYFRLGAAQRLLLLPAGWAVAIVMNIVRALGLSVAALQGSLEFWHDPAGLVILLVVMGVLWWAGLRLAGPAPEAGTSAPSGTSGGPAPAVWLLAGLLAVEGANEAWYRRSETGASTGAAWTVEWEAFPGRREPQAIPETARAMLRYSEGTSQILVPREGELWLAHYLRWEPGRAAALLARSHTPEVCLPAGGARLLEKSGPTAWRHGGVELQVWSYAFDWRGQRLEVRYAMSEQGVSTAGQDVEDYYSRNSRLAAAWEGRRHRGQRVLQVAMSGTVDADGEFRRFLDAVVRAEGGK